MTTLPPVLTLCAPFVTNGAGTDADFFTSLSHDNLANLPEAGLMRALELGLDLQSLRSAPLNV